MHSQVLSMSSKYGDKRTNVCLKAKQKCVLLGIGVLSMSSKSRVKRTCMSKIQMDLCPFSYWRAREGSSECTGKFHQSPETKKEVICRSTSSIEARA